VLGVVLDSAVELVEQGHAGRAGALGQRQQRALPLRGAGSVVAGVAGEHHAVDDERVLARSEQLGEPDGGRIAVRCGSVQGVILGEHAAGRQRAPGGRHGLHRAPQLDLLREQPIARRPVLR
jgi:hypothetical protein